jgi:hypothetical protein
MLDLGIMGTSVVEPRRWFRYRVSAAEVAAIRLLLTLCFPLQDTLTTREAREEVRAACAVVAMLLQRVNTKGGERG